MGTPSVELDALLSARLRKTEGIVRYNEGSITEQLQKVSSPLRKRPQSEFTEIKSLVNKNMTLQHELEKQQQQHEKDIQFLKQQNEERDEETQKQMKELQSALESMQAQFEYDLHFDMLNDMPRDKAMKVCELIDSLEKEKKRIRDGGERRTKRMTSPRIHNINRCDSFHLVGASPRTVMTPNTVGTPERTITSASPGTRQDESFESQEHPGASGTESAASVSSDDEDITPSDKKKSTFKLSFVQDSFPTLVVSALPGRDANLKDVVKLTTAITDVLDRTDITEFVAIYDIRDLEAPSSPVVLEIANWCRVNEHRFHRRLRAAAIILVDNLWAKAVGACVWAVTCIAPPVCPFQIVSTPEEAEVFLNTELEALRERKQMKEKKRSRSKRRRSKSKTRSESNMSTVHLKRDDEDEEETCSSVGGSRRSSRRGSESTPAPAPEYHSL